MKSLTPILAWLAIVLLLLLGGYTGAYVWMGTYSAPPPGGKWLGPAYPGQRPPHITRVYSSEWMCSAFTPAAWVESKVRGVEVELLDGSDVLEDLFQ